MLHFFILQENLSNRKIYILFNIILLMKEKFLRLVRKHGTSLAVSIPAEIVDIMKIKEGDMLRVTIEQMKKDGNK